MIRVWIYQQTPDGFLMQSLLTCFQDTAQKYLHRTLSPRLGQTISWHHHTPHFQPPSTSSLSAHQAFIALLSISRQQAQGCSPRNETGLRSTQSKPGAASPYLLCFVLLKHEDRWSNGRFFCGERAEGFVQRVPE